MDIVPARAEDAPALLEIYAPYVRTTAVTFECDVPSVEEFRQRIETISAKYPYIKAVAQDDDGSMVLGYAYVSAFKGRAAYDWSVETSVYVRQDARRAGVGRALYAALERCLRAMGVQNMNACIAAIPESWQGANPYLTDDSVRFHERMGFSLVGRFHSCASKFGEWFDMMWMEKLLGNHELNPAPVRFGAWQEGLAVDGKEQQHACEMQADQAAGA